MFLWIPLVHVTPLKSDYLYFISIAHLLGLMSLLHAIVLDLVNLFREDVVVATVNVAWEFPQFFPLEFESNPLRCKGEESKPSVVVELQVFVMSSGILGSVDGIVIDITSSMPKSESAMEIKSNMKNSTEC